MEISQVMRKPVNINLVFNISHIPFQSFSIGEFFFFGNAGKLVQAVAPTRPNVVSSGKTLMNLNKK